MPDSGASASRCAEVSSFQLGRAGCGARVVLAAGAAGEAVCATTAPVLAVMRAAVRINGKDLRCKRCRLQIFRFTAQQYAKPLVGVCADRRFIHQHGKIHRG